MVAIDGVARKLVEKAECGLFVEPENSEQLAATLKKLQTDPMLRKQMGENGYRFVREHFDRKQIAKKYIKMIEEKVLSHSDVRAVKS